MKRLSHNYFLLIILVTIAAKSNAQTFHMNALDAYWEMTETLKKGDSLSQKTWENFLNLEPNQIYIKNQGFDKDYLERLRRSIQVVYMPQNAEILKKRVLAIEKDPSTYWLTYKVYVYKIHEKELKDFQQKLVSPDYLSQIYKNSFSWLPKYLQKKDDTVNIYLLGIENDAIAGSGTVIATLWNLYNADKIQTGALLGHEMHHVLRKPFHFNVEKQDEGIMYFLNAVLNEGTADMIDKPTNIANQNTLPFGLGLTDFLIPQADSIVTQVNKDIVAMKKSSGKNFKTEKDYRNLIQWTSGHKPGYFMADIIVRNGYRNQLLENIQNPFKFIYLYNKAANKDSKNPPVFTDDAIKYIKMMEKKYWYTKSN